MSFLYSSQLSNKVNYNQLGIGNKGANIPQNDCNKIEESGFFRCGPDALNTFSQSVGIGDPQGEIITSSVWDFNVRAQISITPNKHMGYRSYWGGLWYPWKPIATAEPPQEFNIPLVAGFIADFGANTYYKDNIGVVTITVSLRTSNNQNTIQNSVLIGNLPVGYRPPSTYNASAVTRTNEGYTSGFSAVITVLNNGEIHIGSFGAAAIVHAQISFPAAL